MSKACKHCYVTGRVQGVYYRESTRRKAVELGVTGWVRNLPDGRVEVMVAGEPDKVESLCQWLKKGPMLAKVQEVSIESAPWQDFLEFTIK